MQQERFSGLKFKIYGLDEHVVVRYPNLLKYEPIAKAQLKLKDDDALDKILRYVIFLYDPETELNSELPDLNERKAEAQTLAGLGKAEQKHITGFNELKDLYKDIVHCFLLEIYHKRKHTEWHTAQQELSDLTRKRWDNKLDNKERASIGSMCDNLNKKLDELEEEIYGDHDDVKESVIVDRWSSPEKFAAPTLKLVS